MSLRFSTAFAAVSFVVASSACSGTHECEIDGSERIEVAVDQTCPSAADAARPLERAGLHVSNVTLADRVEHGPETICWYRKVTDPPYPCGVDDRQRTHLLDRIGRWNALTITKYGEFCDGDEHVVAYPVPAPSGGLAECPSSRDVQEELELVSNAKITGLTSRDALAARVACSYKTTTSSTCTSGGGRIPGLSPE